jgi:diamine N-acetyltransferase
MGYCINSMMIRKAKDSDASNIAALGMCVWVDTYAAEGVFDKISKFIFSEFTKQKILKLINSKTVFVSENEKCLLGYIVLGPAKGDKVEIETLYVLPRLHGAGLGKQLLEQVLKSPHKNFWLSTWELNHKAIGFYKKFGFEETDELYFDLYGDKIRNIVLEISYGLGETNT